MIAFNHFWSLIDIPVGTSFHSDTLDGVFQVSTSFKSGFRFEFKSRLGLGQWKSLLLGFWDIERCSANERYAFELKWPHVHFLSIFVSPLLTIHYSIIFLWNLTPKYLKRVHLFIDFFLIENVWKENAAWEAESCQWSWLISGMWYNQIQDFSEDVVSRFLGLMEELLRLNKQ